METPALSCVWFIKCTHLYSSSSGLNIFPSSSSLNVLHRTSLETTDPRSPWTASIAASMTRCQVCDCLPGSLPR